MRKWAFLLFEIVLFCPLLWAQSFTASLLGKRIPGGGVAQGEGVAMVTLEGSSLHYFLAVAGVGTPTAAHMHRGSAGVEGEVVVNF